MSQLAGGLAINVGEVYALSAMFVGAPTAPIARARHLLAVTRSPPRSCAGSDARLPAYCLF